MINNLKQMVSLQCGLNVNIFFDNKSETNPFLFNVHNAIYFFPYENFDSFIMIKHISLVELAKVIFVLCKRLRNRMVEDRSTQSFTHAYIHTFKDR